MRWMMKRKKEESEVLRLRGQVRVLTKERDLALSRLHTLKRTLRVSKGWEDEWAAVKSFSVEEVDGRLLGHGDQVWDGKKWVVVEEGQTFAGKMLRIVPKTIVEYAAKQEAGYHE
jgi:hypothetical protein